MDIKVGNGAFMATPRDARALADSITGVAAGAGTPTTALVTDMNQPLASTAGNALEMVYAIDYLTGARREPRMHEVVVSLGAEMLVLGKLARTVKAGRAALQASLDNGAAVERFAKMVKALGGPADIVTSPWKHLERAAIVCEVFAERSGPVTAIDTRRVGLAVVVLGGGRARPQDHVDHAVGLTELAPIGEHVDDARPLAVVHARTEAAAAAAATEVRAAYRVGRRAPAPTPVVSDRITRR
jgi:thymidine phosphorylase